MKKTLLLTHEYYPFHGGIASYCYHLFKNLPPESYLVLTDQKTLNKKAPALSRPLLSTFLRPSWMRGYRVARDIAQKNGIQMVFTPHLLPLGNIAYYLYKFNSIPYVISLHGLDINLALERKRKIAVTILTAAQRIIVNSEATKRIVDSLGLMTPIDVITPCVNDTHLQVDEKTKTQLLKKYGGKRVILTVGRLVRRKGQDTVLRALPEVISRVHDAYYCIVGEGPDHAYFQSIINELHLQKYVDIVPNVLDHELGAYYSIASVFAMPTRKIKADVEGFGIVYLEASHFNLPIVAGQSGGESEALGGIASAVLLDSENIPELSGALIGLLEDRELSVFLGKNAKTHLATLPTWHQQAERLQKILS